MNDIAPGIRGDGIWRQCAGCPSGYYVSTKGHVRGRSGRILIPRLHSNGYSRISTYENGTVIDQYIHELVLTAFVGPRPSADHEADHVNRDRADNALTNLRWLTLAENRARRDHARGERHGASILTASDVLAIRADIIAGNRNSQIGTKYGVHRRTISDIRRGRTWKAMR